MLFASFARLAPVGCLAAALTSASACAPEAVPPPPRLDFLASHHAAGTVRQGDEIRHRFEFRNAGGRELRVRDVRVACDCAAEIDAGEVLAPGASGAIEIMVATDDLAGAVRRTATVFSNDPQAPAIRLELAAEVEPIVVIEPRELYVGRVAPGAQVAKAVRVSFADGSPAQLQQLTAAGAIVRPHWTTDGSPADRSFAVTIADDAPAGAFVETVTVRTSHPDRPHIAVKVGGVVVDEAPR